MSGFSDFCIYLNNSFAIWFCTILTCFLPIFMSRNPVFFRQSGFLKNTYLESTCHGEFPDKLCAGSSFSLNRSFFFNLSLIFIQNDQNLRVFNVSDFPGRWNLHFGCTVQFFKKYIFRLYMLWGVSGSKNFPGQNQSGIRFCPKSIIFRHFS